MYMIQIYIISSLYIIKLVGMISPNQEYSPKNKYQRTKLNFVFKPLGEDRIDSARAILNDAFVN